MEKLNQAREELLKKHSQFIDRKTLTILEDMVAVSAIVNVSLYQLDKAIGDVTSGPVQLVSNEMLDKMCDDVLELSALDRDLVDAISDLIGGTLSKVLQDKFMASIFKDTKKVAE